MNVFEGSRRIAIVFLSISALIWLVLVINSEPYVSMPFSINGPGENFVKDVAFCPSGYGREEFPYKTKTGKKISIVLCLIPKDFGDGELLIPFKKDVDGRIFWTAVGSQQYKLYALNLSLSFSMTDEQERMAEDLIRTTYLKKLAENIGGLILYILATWASVTAIGWIVRGFMGIPRGMDSRPE